MAATPRPLLARWLRDSREARCPASRDSRTPLFLTVLLLLAPWAAAATVTLGERAAGELASAEVPGPDGRRSDAWRLEFPPTRCVLVELTSEAFDPVLRVALPGGEVLEDDDSAGGLNARLLLPAVSGGPASATVTSFGRDATGRYHLRLASVPSARIAPGAPHTATLLDTAMVFDLPVRAGEWYLIDLVSKDFDPTLAYHGPGGQRLFDDDSGEGYNARLLCVAEASGEAALTVAPYTGRGGEFTLTSAAFSELPRLDIGDATPAAGVSCELTLVPGGPRLEVPGPTPRGGARAESDEGGGPAHSGSSTRAVGLPVAALRASPEQRLVVRAHAETFDPVLFALAPDDWAMEDDDSGPGTDARLAFEMPPKGQVFLLVTPYEPGTGGAVTLTAAKAPPAVLPAFTLRDPWGREVSSEEFEGRVRVLDVWASWSGLPEERIAVLRDLARAWGDRGVTVIGLSVDDSPPAVRQFAREHHMDYTVLMADEAVIAALGCLLPGGVVDEYPTLFVVARDGRVLFTHAGPLGAAELAAQVEAALTGMPASAEM